MSDLPSDLNVIVTYDIEDDELRREIREFLNEIAGLNRVQDSVFDGSADRDIIDNFFDESPIHKGQLGESDSIVIYKQVIGGIHKTAYK